MSSKFLFAFYVILHAESLLGKAVNDKPLRLKHLTKCTYDYEVTVYTARGDKSTHSDGYQVHALVSVDSFSLKASDLPKICSLIPLSCTTSVTKYSNYLPSPCWSYVTSPLSIFDVDSSNPIVMLRCVKVVGFSFFVPCIFYTKKCLKRSFPPCAAIVTLLVCPIMEQCYFISGLP